MFRRIYLLPSSERTTVHRTFYYFFFHRENNNTSSISRLSLGSQGYWISNNELEEVEIERVLSETGQYIRTFSESES